MARFKNKKYRFSDKERVELNKELHEVSTNINIAKKIINEVVNTISHLEYTGGRPAGGFWYYLFFAQSDRLDDFHKARIGIENINTMINSLINNLKNIENSISDYTFKEYGIVEEFAQFYKYYKSTKVENIKYYVFKNDVDTLTKISEKAAKIMHDLSDLHEKLSI